jgi:hypothetical protein
MKDIQLKDFFMFRERLPTPVDDDFQEIVDEELDRCLGGVRVDGVEFSGFLYWHINHWWIRDDYCPR